MADIICEISGGLGNQMFCYASAYAVSKYLNIPLLVDTSTYAQDQWGRDYQLSQFSISAKESKLHRNSIWGKLARKIKLNSYSIISETTGYKNLNDFIPLKNRSIYLDLFWHIQNYKIFHKYHSELKNEFRYVGKKSASYEIISKKIEKFHSISIHMRFGDYVKIGCCIDESYYIKACNQACSILLSQNKTMENMLFVVFSEDIQQAKSIIGKCYIKENNILFIDTNYQLSDLEEFELMRKCDSHIISNSTFSWWAAYLNYSKDNIVVAPVLEKWMDNGCWKKGYFPEEWITIDASN